MRTPHLEQRSQRRNTERDHSVEYNQNFVKNGITVPIDDYQTNRNDKIGRNLNRTSQNTHRINYDDERQNDDNNFLQVPRNNYTARNFSAPKNRGRERFRG